jgi:hypothetical protein
MQYNHCHRATAHLQFNNNNNNNNNILGISFMQDIYAYIPETNHVPREHRVAAILVLLFIVLTSLVPALTPLYLYVSTFRGIIIIIIIIIIKTDEDAL